MSTQSLCSATREATTMRSPHTVTRESLRAATLSIAKNYIIFFLKEHIEILKKNYHHL